MFFSYRSYSLPFTLTIVLSLTACSSINSNTAPENNYQLTTITSTATNQSHPGKFIWHDLLTHDTNKSKQFYAQLFGWRFEESGSYSVIFNNDKKIGGILEVKPKSKTDSEAVWLASMSVANIDSAISLTKSSGGQILKGPFDMKARGRGVLIKDPQGAQLILLNSHNSDPVDDEIKVGDWLWNEIWTHSPDKTLSFYSQLGQYNTVLQNKAYHILINEEQWRAGIRQVFDKDIKVRWVPTIRVADPNALLDKVKELGGQVILKTGEYPNNKHTALIADNTGALLMIQQWDSSHDTGVK